MRAFTHWRWHLDEVYVKINGEMRYLWRAVDHEGEVLESFVTKKRDRAAALQFIREIMKRHGRPRAIVTDRPRSYGAALKETGGGGAAGNRALVQQQSRELAPAVPATRAGDAAIPRDENTPEIRLGPCPGSQPFQSGTPPRQP